MYASFAVNSTQMLPAMPVRITRRCGGSSAVCRASYRRNRSASASTRNSRVRSGAVAATRDAPATSARAVGNGLAKVGAPLPEVVIDVNRGHTCSAGAPLQRGQPDCHWLGLGDQSLGPLEGQIVDDVDQQQGRSRDGHRARATGRSRMGQSSPAANRDMATMVAVVQSRLRTSVDTAPAGRTSMVRGPSVSQLTGAVWARPSFADEPAVRQLRVSSKT